MNWLAVCQPGGMSMVSHPSCCSGACVVSCVSSRRRKDGSPRKQISFFPMNPLKTPASGLRGTTWYEVPCFFALRPQTSPRAPTPRSGIHPCEYRAVWSWTRPFRPGDAGRFAHATPHRHRSQSRMAPKLPNKCARSRPVLRSTRPCCAR